MKTCSELKHLEQFGIKLLTGEADALGYRILCDLDEQGVRVFKGCFGIPQYSKEVETCGNRQLAPNWNSGSIASVMLTGHELVPLAIMGFYLQGHDVVVTRHKDDYEQVFALEVEERVTLDNTGSYYVLYDSGDASPRRWPATIYGRICRIIRQRKSDGKVVQGTRNVHQMSRRVS